MSRSGNPQGVVAALLLPRDERGAPTWEAFDANASFVIQSGLAGVCVNGATGEYASATPYERREATVRARRVIGSSGIVVSGIGSARWTESRSLAEEAVDAGADALLIPVPHFFGYEQHDLEEFFSRIAADLRVPAMLYNLPAFSGSIETPVVLSVLRKVPFITGIKDSSGELVILEALSQDTALNAVRIMGNDGALSEALDRKLCDCVISGVAGVLPELIQALWDGNQAGNFQRKHRVAVNLSELLSHLAILPIPWGLKVIAEMRFDIPAHFSLPLSRERQHQIQGFRNWFCDWWPQAEADLGRI
jgi:4-hydroxy-tetrahydrodipicolinate synthase